MAEDLEVSRTSIYATASHAGTLALWARGERAPTGANAARADLFLAALEATSLPATARLA